MTAPAGDFRVVRSEAVRQQIRQLSRRAAALGLAGDFRSALAGIETQLGSRPLEWGDPHNRYQVLGLVRCRRIYWHLIVEYAVEETRRVVFVLAYRAMPLSPLAPED